jgi:DNA-binding PadR family transcriptional regulator
LPAKHLVLGVLVATETHGYAIQRSLLATLGPAFAIPPARVYALLNQLERDGLISVRSGGRARHGPRRSFHIEAAGREEYQRWLGAPTSCASLLRSELLVKLTLVLECGPGALAAIVAAERAARVRAKMDLHRQIARVRTAPTGGRTAGTASPSLRCPANESRPPSTRVLERLELQRALRHLQVELDALEELERFAPPPVPAPRAEAQPTPSPAFASVRAKASAFK